MYESSTRIAHLVEYKTASLNVVRSIHGLEGYVLCGKTYTVTLFQVQKRPDPCNERFSAGYWSWQPGTRLG